MGFKMKNPAMAKLVKKAGDSRVAMKMANDPAMKMAKDPAMNKLTDLSGDGKVTQKDVLIGKGVIKPPTKMAQDPAMKKAPLNKAPLNKTYREAYDGLSASAKAKYSGYSDFLKQAKEYNMKKYGTTEPTKAGFDTSTGKKKGSGSSSGSGSGSTNSRNTKSTSLSGAAERNRSKTVELDEDGKKTGNKSVTVTDDQNKVVRQKDVKVDPDTGDKTKTVTKSDSTRKTKRKSYREAVKAWRDGGKQGDKPKRKDYMRA